ncbi:unnamed protein product [Spirodela intermedia]|uniref:Myb/SANT-like DNA-binding domain-containing protein n=1 Tax=Spirodela intermedia TaxID=51605 RepID=A0A7I8J864_SPIIN|nr:unnamed protein product [Spirodela intermedia]CAA6665622.1 unnamed protein product [Spirodela intermedia]
MGGAVRRGQPGNLRRKHWQEVADVINSRRTDVPRPARSDIQCKNRIDTLKKKYKMERIRIRSGDGKAASLWPFYDRLDFLIGASSPSLRRVPPSRPTASPEKTLCPNGRSQSLAIFNDKGKATQPGGSSRGLVVLKAEVLGPVLHFGEIYERVEAAKQQQMLELEKQRMESTRSLETKMMQIFVDYQIQFEKLKRHKRAAFGEFEASSSLLSCSKKESFLCSVLMHTLKDCLLIAFLGYLRR